jgi:hypothetical protein
MNTEQLLQDIAVRSPENAERLRWEFTIAKLSPEELFMYQLKATRQGKLEKAQFIKMMYRFKTDLKANLKTA